MLTEKINRSISNSVPTALSQGITMKEVPGCFVDPWLIFINGICKNSSFEKAPDFITNSLPSVMGISNFSNRPGETTWGISRNISDNKSVERKVFIRKSNGAPNIEEIELIEVNNVKGSTGSRRVIIKFDSLEHSIRSV